GRERDDIRVADLLALDLQQLRQVELEYAPGALEHARVQLADHTGARPSRLARVQERVLGALERRIRLQRGIERVDDALRTAPAAVDDRGDPRLLVRELAVREEDARDLEQRDAVGAELDVAGRGLDEAREQSRP